LNRHRALLVESFEAAVGAADARRILGAHLPPERPRRVLVVGAGKAAAAMAYAVEQAWADQPLEGIVITRYGHGVPTASIEVVLAGHPVPDAAGESAARRILAEVAKLTAKDLLIVLISGGGSSLMTLPAAGLSIEDVMALNRELLRSGAPITAMNIIRKHVSAISGGRLAAASAAPVLALIISDVTGDDPSAIASGPCAPDPSTFQEALQLIGRHGVRAPQAVLRHLEQGALGLIEETPKPGDAVFARVENRIIATPHESLVAAQAWFHGKGLPAVILGDTVTGEAREVAKVYAALVREIREYGQPWHRPVALISGGECTVTIDPANLGTGRGGRCTEFLLALALELDGLEGVYALACDTDGIDGSEDNAGAVLFPDSLARASEAGLSGRAALDANDAWDFFARTGDLIVTGPTRTNVNDYRVILIT
jgi:hydroxypyruvate reductase